MAIASLKQFKAFLGVPDSNTVQDYRLGLIIAAADSIVKDHCGRDFEVKTYTEFYNGTGSRFIILNQRPVTSVASVYLDYNAAYGDNPQGAFGIDSLLQQGVDYALDRDQPDGSSAGGLLTRLKTIWLEVGRSYYPGKLTSDIGPALGSIKVTYTAGYAVIPLDLVYATCCIGPT